MAAAHPLLLSFLLFKLVTCIAIAPAACPRYDFCSCSLRGPQHWGDLCEDWALCKTGREQSPIDIHTHNVNVVVNAQGLQTEYQESPAVLKVDRYGVQVEWTQGNAGFLRINDRNYPLLQFHFHHPSEHTINGVRFPLEMHAVHITDGNDIAVVGFLYKIGETEDPFLAQWVTSRLPSMFWHHEEQLGLVRLTYPEGAWDYYRYNGSLTTPGCTEGVIWTLMTHIFTITEGQLEAIRRTIPEPNTRPVQKMNGRSVLRYEYETAVQASSYLNMVS